MTLNAKTFFFIAGAVATGALLGGFGASLLHELKNGAKTLPPASTPAAATK